MDEVKSDKKRKLSLTKLQVAVLAFLLGAALVVGLRFAAIKDMSVHYHANFALYVNGQRDEFKSFTFYEEVQACSTDDANNVKAKAHMHDNNPGLVHVHAAGMTWAQFFSNLGYGLSNKALTTDAGVYVSGQDGNALSFVLNGKPVAGVANDVIKSEDRLLINYGKDSDQTLQDRYKTVPTDAHQANTENDPAACGGASHKLTFTDRLKQAVGLSSEESAHSH
jgi:hypothetical protein